MRGISTGIASIRSTPQSPKKHLMYPGSIAVTTPPLSADNRKVTQPLPIVSSGGDKERFGTGYPVVPLKSVDPIAVIGIMKDFTGLCYVLSTKDGDIAAVKSEELRKERPAMIINFYLEEPYKPPVYLKKLN